MKKQNKETGLISFILYLYAFTAFAAPAPIITSTQGKTDDESRFGIGMTTSVAKRPFTGVNTQNATLLYLSYRNKDFYIEGLDLGYNFYKNNNLSVDLLATPRFYEVKSSFAANGELDGIDSTKETYFTGLSVQLNAHNLVYTFQLLHDPIESKGNEVVIQISKAVEISETFTLTPSFGLVNQDKTLVGHFYGVQANEVKAGRPQYSGKNALNYNLTLNARWDISKHFQLLGQVKYEKIGTGITDSPIIDKDTLNFITLGIVYRY